ncbi:MAG: putative inner membrane protein [Syntrophorhabdus sp. PtaU1.Bin153]|nr:MAG: putative inner membrane protein [Syntrophorhabdus sp. PtaU1.Bin153]
MSRKVQEPRGWSPYLAGALAGVLIVFSVWFTGKYVGASTTFVRAAGYIERAAVPERVGMMEYFLKEAPKIDWQFLFVIGIFFGSLIASTTSKSFRWQAVPTMWEQRFGPSRTKRAIAAFVGGAIAIFGARLADG